MIKKNWGALASAAIMAGTVLSPVAALAATPTENGKGLVDGYQETNTDNSGWQDSKTKTDGEYQDGKIHLFYDTTGGQWQDPGKDPEKADDNTSHDNGTFVVTIPTKIAYENMNIGTVSTSDSYTVNVRGTIAQDKKVTLTAETGKNLENGSKKTEITETTTQTKTEWSAAETYGQQLNHDGSLSGTDTTDKIEMRGTVTTAGIYEGAVQYTATLVKA